MTPLRALVADDEAHVRADLVRVLESMEVVVAASATHGEEALALLLRERFDVAFLDIHMPGLDGLNVVARAQMGAQPLPPIVFVTAHAEHASHAFELDACDYVLKPVSKERVQLALSRVLRRVRIEQDEAKAPRLRVTDARGSRLFDVRRIEAFRALEKYVAFSLDGEEHLLRESLDELETRFASLGFLRCHRAHLVRRDAVTRTEDGAQGLVLALSSGLRIPVSKRARAAVLRALSDTQ